MQVQIVPIGNSLGLRLPKAVLDSLHLGRASTVSIQVKADSIVLKPLKNPRSDWALAFAADPPQAPENLWGDMPVDDAWGD
jgi:antitoxin MazE